MRSTTLLAVLIFFTPVNAQDKAARKAWRYHADGKPGYFVNTIGKRWMETNQDGARLFFNEVQRVAGFVELFDANRNMTVRLFDDRFEWSLVAGKWNRLHAGGWIAASEVPPSFKETDHRIRLAYFLPKDRKPTADFEKKIRVLMHFVADLYESDLAGHGFKLKRLAFEMDGKVPRVHRIDGSREAVYYNGGPKYDVQQQWRRIIDEIPPSVGRPSQNVLIVFAETYDDGPAKFEWPGGIALGGRFSSNGGVGIFSAWILRPEFAASTLEQQRKFFFDRTPIKGRTALGHGGKDSPRFEFIEDGFGAVAHELGHALGLAHDTRDERRDVMGNGFRNFALNLDPKTPSHQRVGFSLDNARLLATSRYLAADLDLGDNTPPTLNVKITRPLNVGDTMIDIAVTTSDDRELRAITIFAHHQDSVIGGRRLKGRESAFKETLKVRALPKGEVSILVQVADGGGNLTTSTVKAQAK